MCWGQSRGQSTTLTPGSFVIEPTTARRSEQGRTMEAIEHTFRKDPFENGLRSAGDRIGTTDLAFLVLHPFVESQITREPVLLGGVESHVHRRPDLFGAARPTPDSEFVHLALERRCHLTGSDICELGLFCRWFRSDDAEVVGDSG